MTTIPQHDLHQIPKAVREIEANGYDGISTLENRHDPFLPLGIAAVNTQKLELSTGIAIAFSRSPMTVANIGWDLQAASGVALYWGLAVRSRVIRSGASAFRGRHPRLDYANMQTRYAPSGTRGKLESH